MYKSNIFNIREHGRINDVGELVEQLTSIRSTKTDLNIQLFYRGESRDYGTKLLPTIYRPCYKDESFYYYDALTNFPQEFESLSSLSRLAKMQHYWYPTRLLDLTSNPLVALYFACSGDENEIGCFYILKTKEVLNYDSDRVLLLSCLAHLNTTQQQSLFKLIYEFVNSEYFAKKSDRISKDYINQKKKGPQISKTNDNNGAFQFERLIGEAVKERVSFLEYNTVAKDLLNPYFVRPLIQNERQKKQDGLFLIMGLIGDKEFSVELINRIDVMCFYVDNKKRILNELDLLGINQATLFGDLESRVKYLNSNLIR